MYDIPPRLGEHPNLVRFEKRAVKTLQHGQIYGDVFLFHEMTNTDEWWSALIDTNYIFVANYYAFPVYIVFFFLPNTVSKYQTWTNSYLIPSNASMQQEVPGDPGAGTSSYWVMPSNTATKISTIFRDRVITKLIYLLVSAAMVFMMFCRLIWIHFFYHFLAIRLYHEFLSQLNCHFDIAFFEHYLLQTTTAAELANEILWNFTYPHWNNS